ncbi:hypothetical protein GCM10020367_40860 [Streptomyces sannanensis]|uniref:Uncharacterized protein n=1 Tax=Streptomyces sannanensis TaxID=285536 RepID=A0ABP6SET5_9ACTN
MITGFRQAEAALPATGGGGGPDDRQYRSFSRDADWHGHPDLTPIPVDPPLPTRTVALLTREGAYRSAAPGLSSS